jgi:hypothetical protein
VKFQHLITAAVFGLAVHQAVAKSPPTNSFGIYLFAESVDWRESASNWTSRALSPTPVLSEADILFYTFTNHLMTLTSEAAQRIARLPIPDLIEPFVVVVNGERIYRGTFVLSVCSGSVALPSITLWGFVLPTPPPNSFCIERTYAAPFSKTDPDPRSDIRVKRALEMLHKLK